MLVHGIEYSAKNEIRRPWDSGLLNESPEELVTVIIDVNESKSTLFHYIKNSIVHTAFCLHDFFVILICVVDLAQKFEFIFCSLWTREHMNFISHSRVVEGAFCRSLESKLEEINIFSLERYNRLEERSLDLIVTIGSKWTKNGASKITKIFVESLNLSLTFPPKLFVI